MERMYKYQAIRTRLWNALGECSGLNLARNSMSYLVYMNRVDTSKKVEEHQRKTRRLPDRGLFRSKRP